MLLHLQRVLLCGPVVVAEEAGPLGDAVFIHFGGGGADARGVPLHGDVGLAAAQRARLHLLGEVLIVLCGQGPLFQLVAEEFLHLFRAHLVLPEAVEGLTGFDFAAAQTVLVEVVEVLLLLREIGVGVALPAAAEIELVVDAPDAVAARDHQAQSVVFAVARVGDLYLAQDGCEEGSRRAQSVDTQRVVASVLLRPFAMVDESGRQRLQLEVADAIRAHHHRGVVVVELLHNPRQRVLAAVEVVAVELHHEAAHALVVHGAVPASTDAQIVPLGNDVDEPLVAEFVDGFGGSVVGMVVHHHQVVFEGRLLPEDALYGIAYGAHPVADGDHHRRFHGEFALVELHHIHLVAVQIGVDGPQMTGAGPLHLHLCGAVAGIDVVKLLHAAGSQVGLVHAVEEFADVQRQPLSRAEEAQVVERGKLIEMRLLLHVLLQRLAAQHHETAHLEVVAHRARLAVDQPHVALLAAVVAVAPGRAAVVHHRLPALQRVIARRHCAGLRVEQDIGRLAGLGDAAQGVCGAERTLQRIASCEERIFELLGCMGEKVYHFSIYCFVFRHKDTKFFPHFQIFGVYSSLAPSFCRHFFLTSPSGAFPCSAPALLLHFYRAEPLQRRCRGAKFAHFARFHRLLWL